MGEFLPHLRGEYGPRRIAISCVAAITALSLWLGPIPGLGPLAGASAAEIQQDSSVSSGQALARVARGQSGGERSKAPPTDGEAGRTNAKRPPTNFVELKARARALAEQSYVEPVTDLPPVLERMDYDAYRRIQYRQKAAVWGDLNLPFQLRLYHRGGTNRQRVHLFTLDQGQARELQFDPAKYQYDLAASEVAKLPDDLGFAGMWVLTHLNNDQGRPIDELISFLGGTYFRALSKGQHYGSSCRALGLNIGRDHEEFPTFKALYVKRPSADAQTIRILALLDSPSIAGAYQFDVDPGSPTVIDVRATVFARSSVESLNLAPITSMFLYGEQKPSDMNEDFRPEVHDSDGLLMINGDGEFIFRPLRNPKHPAISRYKLTNPRGFGLVQRDRDFESYQDLEALYNRRPSVWIEPKPNPAQRPHQGSQDGTDLWKQSVVELVEFPSDNEGFDNVNASWVYPRAVEPGKPISYGYRIHLLDGDPPSHDAGKAVATRFARKSANELRWLVDFSGGRLDDLPEDAPVEAVVTAIGADAEEPIIQHNPYQKGWRVQVEVNRPSGKPVEIRAFLKLNDDVLTETWSYQWTP